MDLKNIINDLTKLGMDMNKNERGKNKRDSKHIMCDPKYIKFENSQN